MEARGYEVRPFPPLRRATIDVLRAGQRRHLIHGLVEVDVAEPRRRIAALRQAGGDVSFTAFIAACVGRAVAADRMLHAHRWGRKRLVLFDDVDVNLQIAQTEADGTQIIQSKVLRAVQTKTPAELTAEIRSAQAVTEADRRRKRAMLALSRLPRPFRSLTWRAMLSRPWWTKRLGGTVAVSSVGMFGDGLGWGIPISPAPLSVTVGGIGDRLVLVDGEVESRPHLSLTISVDHDIVDGAPAAAFTARLRSLIEQGAGLEVPVQR